MLHSTRSVGMLVLCALCACDLGRVVCALIVCCKNVVAAQFGRERILELLIKSGAHPLLSSSSPYT
jgi:hypothetical protein